MQSSRSSSRRTKSKYIRKDKEKQRKKNKVASVVKKIRKVGIKILRGDKQEMDSKVVLKK